jgi:hypothetical protein
MFDENEVARETDGKFAPKTGTKPEQDLLASLSGLDPYWDDVATLYALDSMERYHLETHLQGVDQSEWTTSTTSREIIADALRPHAEEARNRSERADAAFEAEAGVQVHYDSYQSGDPMMVIEAQTDPSYAYQTTAGLERATHYVNLMPYTSADAIPARFAKAKKVAASIEQHEESRRVAYEVHLESQEKAERLELFERR